MEHVAVVAFVQTEVALSYEHLGTLMASLPLTALAEEAAFPKAAMVVRL